MSSVKILFRHLLDAILLSAIIGVSFLFQLLIYQFEISDLLALATIMGIFSWLRFRSLEKVGVMLLSLALSLGLILIFNLRLSWQNVSIFGSLALGAFLLKNFFFHQDSELDDKEDSP